MGPVAQTVVVPAGVTTADVRVIGGKCGGSQTPADPYVTGGDGAQVSGRIAVTAGQVLTLKVAGYGGDADFDIHPGAGGWGATGNGGRGGGASYGDGGGGGGASAVEIGGEMVVVAGGGGGAGGVGIYYTRGGPGGSSGGTVDPGHNGTGLGAGKGGGGGAESHGAGGGGRNGSNLGGAGGGGGAGARGGAGGAGGGTGGGGGGGGGAGSSHYTARLEAPVVVRGGTSDGNGLIFITWSELAAPICYDQAIHVPLDSPGVAVRLRCTQTTSFRLVALPVHGYLENRDLTAGTFSYVLVPGYTGTDSLVFEGRASGFPPGRQQNGCAVTSLRCGSSGVLSSGLLSFTPDVLRRALRTMLPRGHGDRQVRQGGPVDRHPRVRPPLMLTVPVTEFVPVDHGHARLFRSSSRTRCPRSTVTP